MDKLTPLKPLPSLCALAATLIIWFLIPVPEGVAPNAWQLLALFIGTIIAIIGKAMPIGAVSVIAIALVAVTGVTNPGKPGAALDDALSGFSNQLIWLIGFSIMISLSLNKTGLGARIGYYFISLFGKNARHRLRIDVGGNHPGAGDAEQHRARRRHHSPDHEIDRRQLWFQT